VLAPPRFHHLHLNSVDPDAAIDFYVKRFPTSERTRWSGAPALRAPNDVLLLFERVATPPPTAPQTAIWHFGWHVPDTWGTLRAFQSQPDVALLPLYTGDGAGSVWVSSDTWPGTSGVLGRTAAQIEEAKASGVQPTRKGGFGYLRGPDGALVEYAGNHPAERFNHVHFFHEDPVCAQLWYQRHLGAQVPAGRAPAPGVTASTCRVPRGPDHTFPALERHGLARTPVAGVAFGDVTFPAYMRQDDRPLVSTRGHLYDHVALSVDELEPWVDRLRGEGVTVLEEPYRLGATRAFMIEGPSREAIELVEAR
jgi:catechol 2,3-dioxygenase-like lactoylglutathione lyase family enzyme